MGSNFTANETLTKYLLRFEGKAVLLKGKTIIDPWFLEENFDIELQQDKHTNLLSISLAPFGSSINIKKECFLIQIGYRFSIEEDWVYLLDSDIINIEVGCFLKISIYELILTLGSLNRDPPKSFLRDYSPIEKECIQQNMNMEEEEKSRRINTQSISSEGFLIDSSRSQKTALSRSQKTALKRASDDVWNYLEDKLEVSLKKHSSKGGSNPDTLRDQKESTQQKSPQSITINDNEIASISAKNPQLDSFPQDSTSNNVSQKSKKGTSGSNSKQSLIEPRKEEEPQKLFSTQSEKPQRNLRRKSNSLSQKNAPKLRSAKSLLDDSSDDDGVRVRRFENFDAFFEVFFGDEEATLRKNRKIKPANPSKIPQNQRTLASENSDGETINNKGQKPPKSSRAKAKLADDYSEDMENRQMKAFSSKKTFHEGQIKSPINKNLAHLQDTKNSDSDTGLKRFKMRNDKNRSFEDKTRDKPITKNNRGPPVSYRESVQQTLEVEEEKKEEDEDYTGDRSNTNNKETKALVFRLLSGQKNSNRTKAKEDKTNPLQRTKPLSDDNLEDEDWFESHKVHKKIKLNDRTGLVKENENPKEFPNQRVLRSGKFYSSNIDLDSLNNQTKNITVTSENRSMQREKSGLCRICMGEIAEEYCRLEECSHLFCYSCIIEWAELTTQCPLCKQVFSGVLKYTSIGRKPERIPIKVKNVVSNCDWQKYFQHQCSQSPYTKKNLINVWLQD